MERAVIEQFFDAHPQFDRQAWLALARPCVDISFDGEPQSPSDSRFGGEAWVPEGFTWPRTEQDEPYRFLGQFNFSQADGLPAELPTSGLLSLFVDEDEDGFWGDDHFVRGYFWEEDTDFVLTPAPPHPERSTVSVAKRIILSAGLDLPIQHYLEVPWPADKDAVHDAIYEAGLRFRDHILGYPNNDSLGYDPRPQHRDGAEGDWVNLLNIDSDRDLQLYWHDEDKLMVFIEADALRRRDFSWLKSDAG